MAAKSYIVTFRESHVVTERVTANSKAEAIRLVKEGQGERLEEVLDEWRDPASHTAEEETAPVSKYTDDIYAALKISSEIDIARIYGCVVVSYSTAHKHHISYDDRHATTCRFVEGGNRRVKEFRSRGAVTAAEERRACIEAAQGWASKRFEIEEWAPTGFPNSWMPKDVKGRMTADLKQWRKEQKR